ncbi:MAG: hypothetical protein P8Y70_14190 [Candidatus Lokiarchaeota archaeon]
MKILKEFRVNDFITLKLEKGWCSRGGGIFDEYKERYRVQIYVNNEPFRICTYLLLINPHLNEKQGEIQSIDEVREYLSGDLEKKITPRDLGISPEEEFWAHCSNLQAWVEHNYNTRLLDLTLSFPLLRELKRLGDPMAKKVFIKELLNRFFHGSDAFKEELKGDGYFEELTRDQELSLIEDPNDLDILLELEEEYGEKPRWDYIGGEFTFSLKEGKIIGLKLPVNKDISSAISKLVNLEDLWIRGKNLDRFPLLFKNLTKLNRLRILHTEQTKILPDSMKYLKHLKTLDIIACPELEYLPNLFESLHSLEKIIIVSCKNLKSLALSFGNIKKLKVLEIMKCPLLERLPDSFGNLEGLDDLKIRYSGLKRLPESFGNLKCKTITIDSCQLSRLPDSIGNLSVEYLDLRKNKLTYLPETFGNLKDVEKLYLNENQLVILPDSIGNMQNLRVLMILNNNLHTLPESIANLSNLIELNLDRNQFEEFPNALLKMNHLKYLHIGVCKIKQIPSDIKMMKSLKRLTMRKLDISNLPLSLKSIKSLKVIDLKGSKITKDRKEELEFKIGKMIVV